MFKHWPAQKFALHGEALSAVFSTPILQGSVAGHISRLQLKNCIILRRLNAAEWRARAYLFAANRPLTGPIDGLNRAFSTRGKKIAVQFETHQGGTLAIKTPIGPV